MLEHYRLGGRHDAQQDPLIGGFALSARDREDLLAFLESLTDTAILTDARFSDPGK